MQGFGTGDGSAMAATHPQSCADAPRQGRTAPPATRKGTSARWQVPAIALLLLAASSLTPTFAHPVAGPIPPDATRTLLLGDVDPALSGRAQLLASRGATHLLNAVVAAPAAADPALLASYATQLTRPDDLPAHRDTPHFRIHYTHRGPDRPLPGETEAFLDSLARACEQIRTRTLALGWPVPRADGVAGGDGRIDIYVRDLGWGVYGFALHEPVAEQRGAPGFIVLDNDFAGFAGSSPLTALRVTLAHEYQHLVQFGFGYAPEADWFMEQTAVMMEGRIYPQLRERETYLRYFTERPFRRLDLSDGAHEYGAWLWPQYLTERFGAGILVAIWNAWGQGAPSMLAAHEAALRDIGLDLTQAFVEWSLWNAFLGLDSAPAGIGYAARYDPPMTPEAVVASYPVDRFSPYVTRQPEALGASYVILAHEPGSVDNQLEIQLEACASLAAAHLITWPLGGGRPSVAALAIEPSGPGTVSGKHVVEDWDAMAQAMLVLANGRGAELTCGYSLDVRTLYRVATLPEGVAASRLTLAAAPNPFEPSTVIRFAVPESMPVTLKLYDPAGRRLRTLARGMQSAGQHAIEWDGRDERGAPVGAGLYFCVLESQRGERRLRLVRLR